MNSEVAMGLIGEQQRLLARALRLIEDLENQSDICDGPNGELRPNAAMRLLTDHQEFVADLKRFHERSNA